MTIVIFFAYCYVLWVLFLCVMALANAWKTLPIFTKVLALPAVIVAIILDVGLNLAALLIFLDLPREATFSQRMGRYKKDLSWRTPIARWICSNLLDPFERGGHCKG